MPVAKAAGMSLIIKEALTSPETKISEHILKLNESLH